MHVFAILIQTNHIFETNQNLLVYNKNKKHNENFIIPNVRLGILN